MQFHLIAAQIMMNQLLMRWMLLEVYQIWEWDTDIRNMKVNLIYASITLVTSVKQVLQVNTVQAEIPQLKMI